MHTNLFLPYTQYHMLLNYAIAAQNDTDRNIMILGSNSDSMHKCNEILSRLFPDINFCIHTLIPTDKVNNLHIVPIKKRNMRTIKEILHTSLPISRLYYSCERHLYTSYLIHLLRDYGTEFHFVEDGIATYTEKEWIARKNFLERLGDRIIYGAWHESGNIQGQLAGGSKFEFVEALKPEYLLDNFADMQKNAINSSVFLEKLKLENIPDEFKKVTDKNINLFIALDSNTYCNDEYISLMRAYIAKAVSEGWTVAVKKHPDDVNNKELFDKLNVDGKAIDLPAYLPIEIYYLLFSKTLKRIIGSLSTAMITVKWLLPDVEAVSVCNRAMLATHNIDVVLDLFSKFGIKIEKA